MSKAKPVKKDELKEAYWVTLNCLDYTLQEGLQPIAVTEALEQATVWVGDPPLSQEATQSLTSLFQNTCGVKPQERLYTAGWRTLAQHLRDAWLVERGCRSR